MKIPQLLGQLSPTYSGRLPIWSTKSCEGRIPVEQPSKVELVVNLATAKALGIAAVSRLRPPLANADKLIS
jgi:hypothetical protein